MSAIKQTTLLLAHRRFGEVTQCTKPRANPATGPGQKCNSTFAIIARSYIIYGILNRDFSAIPNAIHQRRRIKPPTPVVPYITPPPPEINYYYCEDFSRDKLRAGQAVDNFMAGTERTISVKLNISYRCFKLQFRIHPVYTMLFIVHFMRLPYRIMYIWTTTGIRWIIMRKELTFHSICQLFHGIIS